MIRYFAFAALLCASAPVFAQPDPAPPAADPCQDLGDCGADSEIGLAGSGQSILSGELVLLSDYRFRGVSRSDEDPAIQAALTVLPAGGFYAGARATSLKGTDSFRARDPAFQDLGDVELDLYAGYGAQLGDGFDLDAGLLYYVFAGGDGPTDYAEPYASFSYLIGPVSATAGAKYAPSQDAIGHQDMLYLFGQVDVSIPFRPWSFTLQAGRQDWSTFGSYWTWSAGVEHQLQLGGLPGAEIGLRYVDTNSGMPGADAGLIASLGFRF
jgi:uncharacterized protein (TIGR02001 family)